MLMAFDYVVVPHVRQETSWPGGTQRIGRIEALRGWFEALWVLWIPGPHYSREKVARLLFGCPGFSGLLHLGDWASCRSHLRAGQATAQVPQPEGESYASGKSSHFLGEDQGRTG